MPKGIYHVPVLLDEVIEGLRIIPSGIYVDCTYGGGGHSSAILKKLNGNGKVIAFDQDADARQNILSDSRLVFVPENFRHLQRFLRFHKIGKIDGILADLGVSSHQIDEAARGFSTRFDAALDMRMNQNQRQDATNVVKSYDEGNLQKIFEQFGEVSNAKTLAKTIVNARRLQSIDTIKKFKNALYPVVKGNPEKYFAKVFQALRIEVNGELDSLKELLVQIPGVLVGGARVVFITFHSLEDRIVKNFFRYGNVDGAQDYDVFGMSKENELKVITKKPVLPTAGELKNNPRARSSKLRIAEKNVREEDLKK